MPSGDGPPDDGSERHDPDRAHETITRALEESERRFRALFEGTLDSLVLADDDGRYIDANPASEEFYGLGVDELRGRSIGEFLTEGTDFQAAWEGFLDAGEMRGEMTLRLPDGRRRVVDFAAKANIRPGEHLSVLRDVTERVRQREELAAQRDRLEHLNQVNDLIRAVNRAIVAATSREEVLESACASIGESELYPAAAIATLDFGPTLRATTGVDADVVRAFPGFEGAIERVYDTSAPQELSAVHLPGVDLPGVDSESATVTLFPLSDHDSVQGALVVVFRPTHVVDPDERKILTELASTIGLAVSSVTTRTLLQAESVLVLSLRVSPTGLYGRLLATGVDSITIVALVPVSAERHVHYLTVGEADPAVFSSRAAEDPAVVRSRVVDGSADSGLVELVTENPTLFSELSELGARVSEATVVGGQWSIELEVSPDTDVRGLVTNLRRRHPETTLVAKREVPWRDRGRRVGLDSRDEPSPAGLTSRQESVLRVAFAGGYFDWPKRRTSTADLAQTFDIANSTVNQHLRVAVGKLVQQYLRTR